MGSSNCRRLILWSRILFNSLTCDYIALKDVYFSKEIEDLNYYYLFFEQDLHLLTHFQPNTKTWKSDFCHLSRFGSEQSFELIRLVAPKLLSWQPWIACVSICWSANRTADVSHMARECFFNIVVYITYYNGFSFLWPGLKSGFCVI